MKKIRWFGIIHTSILCVFMFLLFNIVFWAITGITFLTGPSPVVIGLHVFVLIWVFAWAVGIVFSLE